MGDIWIHKNVAFFGDKWGKRKNGKQKTPHQKGCFCLAQRRGFEPPVRFRRTHDFQSCSLNHSDISAKIDAFRQAPIYITVFF